MIESYLSSAPSLVTIVRLDLVYFTTRVPQKRDTNVTKATRVRHECDTSATRVRHEQQECDTSTMQVLHKQHEYDTSEKF